MCSAQLEAFLRACGGGGGGAPRGRAEWGACVVLLSAKHDTPPLALALANAYRCRPAPATPALPRPAAAPPCAASTAPTGLLSHALLQVTVGGGRQRRWIIRSLIPCVKAVAPEAVRLKPRASVRRRFDTRRHRSAA